MLCITEPFKFLNYLTKHPNFNLVVHNAWIQAESICTSLASLCWKLKSIKRDLRNLNRENYSNIQERVKETYNLLQILQVRSLEAPSVDSFHHPEPKLALLKAERGKLFQTKIKDQLVEPRRPKYYLFHIIC